MYVKLWDCSSAIAYWLLNIKPCTRFHAKTYHSHLLSLILIVLAGAKGGKTYIYWVINIYFLAATKDKLIMGKQING